MNLDSTLVVETGSGRVAGTWVEAFGGAEVGPRRVRSWKGIPYAAPPVGTLRWQAPEPAAAWAGVRPATAYGADFPQAPAPVLRAGRMSEDCLTLNVWAPPEVPAGGLPVMVWVHGGGFVGGSGADARTEGHHLAARGVVVVSFNYRSGLFGWLAHPRLGDEAERRHGRRTSGNYGLLDQLAAFAWVQRNVAAFGGDPARVTAFGVSAGSASIALLLTMPAAEGLFQRAILHSPGCGRPLATRAQAEDAAVQAFGDDLDALRALPAAEVLAALPRLNPAVRGLTTPRLLRPIHDGVLVAEDERAAWRAGRLRRMPIVVGTNADEGTLLTRSWPVADAAAARALIEANFPRAAAEALAWYGAAGDGDARAAVAAAFADTQFNGGARGLLRAMARQEPRCHGYRFTRRRPGREHDPEGGPHHGDEAAYVFGHLAVGRAGVAEPHAAQDEAVADAMATAWVAFAGGADLAAGVGRVPPWPAYAAGERWMEFGDSLRMVPNPHDERLDFLDRYLDGGAQASQALPRPQGT